MWDEEDEAPVAATSEPGAHQQLDPDGYSHKVRWVLPQRVSQMTFVGKDVLAVAQDLYIVFLNLRSGVETTYVADGPERGDGVDVICDEEVNRYKALCLMEGELLATFSGYPRYQVAVWSWRTGQRLLALPTGVLRRDQLYVASRSHLMVCQCYGRGLIVWEVQPSFRKCYMMRRSKEPAGDWDVAEVPLVSVAWSAEGQLFALDMEAKFFSVVTDNVKCMTSLEWSDEQLKGSSTPAMVAFGAGFLVYGPDPAFRWLKKSTADKWRLAWTCPVDGGEEVVRLVGSPGADNAVAWTQSGRVLRVVPPAPAAPGGGATALAATPAAATKGASRAAPASRRGRRAARGRGRRSPGAADLAAKIDAAAAAAAAEEAATAAMAAAEAAVPEVRLFAYKQRNIIKLKLLAPEFKHLVTLNSSREICIYEVVTAKLVLRRLVGGEEPTFSASPLEPLLAVAGALGDNYGVALHAWDGAAGSLTRRGYQCLTHQIISRITFSPTGRHIVAGAMSAGNLFIYKVSSVQTLELVRYMEVGRGLADCFLMKVGPSMRAFGLVLFSDKFLIGERIICVNAETGKDNKFAGKMRGPYSRLQPLALKDTMLAVPFLSRHFHILKLSGEKGVTVSVKMGPIVDSGHQLKQFGAARGLFTLLTYGADGVVILRRPEAPERYECKLVAGHRFEGGTKYAAVDGSNSVVVHLGCNGTLGVRVLRAPPADVRHEPPPPRLFHDDEPIALFDAGDKNYLELQEEKKVNEEAQDYKKQRDEVVRMFSILQQQLVTLLEENIGERPLHQLSLSEFNLHMEFKRERLKQAEKEREEIRLNTEARIKAQGKVTAWIKEQCWDSMLTPRVKIFAIFSHYQVENYPVLPTERAQWPELQQVAALRTLEMENDHDVFKPWEEKIEMTKKKPVSVTEGLMESQAEAESLVSLPRGTSLEVASAPRQLDEEAPEGEPYVLSGTGAHKYITVPPFAIPQTQAFSFLQMNWLYELVKYNVQNMRLWFNKQFDDLMVQKRREVGLVGERNARLRFILDELNKLSDLRGSFHHIFIPIKDPEWRQEEEPIKLTKVEVNECSISPYTSQIIVIPPEGGPKDDFRERALMEMMDGVLEKLWHEEIKKPIPKPQCMLDKEPENWNEDDLRLVFDYEAKVKFREGEREKYRRMLHAEYAKLTQVLNDGIVKFNFKVKDMWLMRLKVDSVIGEENLNLMRLRRVNLDRIVDSEELEDFRAQIARNEQEVDTLQAELAEIQEAAGACAAACDALAARDRQMDRTFKNHFADFSPIIVDQCYKFFRRRPKFMQRASMIPAVLHELAVAVGTGVRPPLLHPDCVDYYKGVEQLDQASNMPAVLDETLWATVCRLRRAKIENEIRIRAQVVEAAYTDSAAASWARALQARRAFLSLAAAHVQQYRERVHDTAVNRSLQLVLPAGQVEIETTGHMEDFEDATLIPREDIEAINKLILRVGAIKLRLLRRQIAFRKCILQKEWEHAQMKMKLRHMEQELYSYTRLKLPKELQRFLKDKEKGLTDEDDYKLLEKEMAATKMMIERVLEDSALLAEDLQVKISKVDALTLKLESVVDHLHLKVSEKRINEDALEPIRIRKIFKTRMETLVARSALIRQVQAQHSRIVLLQTELELLRLKTYPTLAAFRTIC